MRRLPSFSFVGALVAALVATALAPMAIASPRGSVTTFDVSRGIWPQAAVDSAGSTTVVWRNTTTERLEMQEVSPDGTILPSGATGRVGATVVSPDGESVIGHRIAIDHLDRVLIVWASVDDGGLHRIRSVRVGAVGAPGPVNELSQNAIGVREPRIAVGADGSAAVAWSERTSADSEQEVVRVTRLNDLGVPGKVHDVSTSPKFSAAQAVRLDPLGRAVVVWTALGITADNVIQVQATRTDVDGVPGPVLTLSSAQGSTFEAFLVLDDVGRATVAWDQASSPGYVVRTVRLDTNFNPGAVQDLTTNDRVADLQGLAVDSRGRALLTWGEYQTSAENIMVRRLTSAGAPDGPAKQLASALRGAGRPRIVVDADDRPTVTWTLVVEDGSSREVTLEAARLRKDLTPDAIWTVETPGSAPGLLPGQPVVSARGRVVLPWHTVASLAETDKGGAIEVSQLHVPAFAATPCTATVERQLLTQDVSVPIPDGDAGGAFGAVTLSSTATILDLDVEVVIAHPRSEQLDLYLIDPDGNTIPLSIARGNGANSFLGTTFNDQGTDGPVSDWPFVGGQAAVDVQPESPLASLAGSAKPGTWTLNVADNAVADTGSIVSWTLAVTTGTPSDLQEVSSKSDPVTIAIPDNGDPLVRTVTFDVPNRLVRSAELDTQLAHTSSGQLDVTLTSPQGTAVTITSGNGGANADVFRDTTFGDFAGELPVTQAGYQDGIAEPLLQPEGAMAAFYGERPSGVWTLEVNDLQAGDTGQLESWTVRLQLDCEYPDSPGLATPVARDVRDTCDGKAPQTQFSDTAGKAHAENVDCISHYGITQGKGDGTYDPGGTLSRGQTATFLVRTLAAAGVTVPAGPDVCDDAGVHAPNVEGLIAVGVIEQSGRDCKVNATISRGAMAQWVRNALVHAGAETSTRLDHYSDDADRPDEYAINEISAAGIVTGTGGGLYAPNANLSRAQMATFLARVIDALGPADSA